MKPIVTLACALFMAGSLPAQVNYNAAIRQAKNASANETAASQRGAEDPTPPAQPPQNNPTPPPDPALQATLQNIENLRNDFTAIAGAAPAASLSAQKQSLTNDLAVAAQGTKPKSESISKLADDLVTAISGKQKLRAPQPKLAQYVHAKWLAFDNCPATDDCRWCEKDFDRRRGVAGRDRKRGQRHQNDCQRNEIGAAGLFVPRAKRPATGLPASSGRFVRSGAGWLTSVNGLAASMSFPSRCGRSISKSLPICRRVSNWTSRRKICNGAL